MQRKLACSFCGKPDDQVQRLMAGPRVFICDGCVARCNEILAEFPPGAGEVRSDVAWPPERRRWWQRLLGWWSAAQPVVEARSRVPG